MALVYMILLVRHKEKFDRIQSQCVCFNLGARRCPLMAVLQVNCVERLLDIRRNMAEVKCALKYKCIPGHPTFVCFQGN